MKVSAVYNKDLTDQVLEELSLLLERGFPNDSKELWKLRFNFWWIGNPHISDDIAVGWILTDDDQKMIDGFMGNIPVLYQINDEKYLGCSSTSWFVPDEMRGREGSSMYLWFTRQKMMNIFINTTPSYGVPTILESLGFKKVGEPNLINYMLIINFTHFISMMASLLTHFSESETGFVKKAFILCGKVGCGISKILPHRKKGSLHQYTTDGTHDIKSCRDSTLFMQYLLEHKRGKTIELSKDKTTLDWMLFSPEVQALLHRKTEQIFTKEGTYCGYIIYDYQHVGTETILRIRELQLLKPENDQIKLIIKHLKIEARNAGCAAIYSGLLAPDPELNKLLHKNISLSLKTKNRYFVKFRKNVITDVDPYAIYVPSDLDPDAGFI